MTTKTWMIGLVDNGHDYLATATYIEGMETWNVVLVVDSRYLQAILTDDPTLDALQLINEAKHELNGGSNANV